MHAPADRNERRGIVDAWRLRPTSGSAGRAESSPVSHQVLWQFFPPDAAAPAGADGRTALSDQFRALPSRPNLRYLKLEARRLAAGEFATASRRPARHRPRARPVELDRAQGVRRAARCAGHPALTQLRWVISRFGGADTPGWAAPADSELREHLTGDALDGYLGQDVTSKAVTALTHRAARWREGLVIIQDDPLHTRARASGWLLEADAEPEPPHRLASLRMTRVGSQVTDARAAAPPTFSSGAVPVVAAETAAARLGSWASPGSSWPALAGRGRLGDRAGLGRPGAGRGRCAPVTGSPPTASPGSSPPPPCCGSSPTSG